MVHYIPSRGDFIVLSFDPQSGHEQKGHRPALVISNRLFNQHTGLVLVCPITNTARNYPFHVPVPNNSSLTGFIMVEQVKSVDYRSRKAKFIEKVTEETLNEALAILDAIVYQ
ncbi:Programmed cell death toxin MazF [hydrothermal vent metagenome]|uniref:Programmed cell death toxin MazF n=1 Tax=hydrothermal vent metagenome TaxID=652676 RepID=A0A3B0VSG9_9ZZZZ